VENSPEARPQSGLSAATIIYEYLAEGGITRFSALYALPPAVRVGPVRSARLATVALQQLYQAVLVYSGASTYILSQLARTGFATYNEDTASGDLFRVSGRVPPHNLYTDGTRLTDLLKRAHQRPTSYPPPPPGQRSSGAPPKAATLVSVPITPAEQPTFRWDAAAHGYVRGEATGPLVDQNTGLPLVAGTVVVQEVPISVAPEVHDVNGYLGVRHTLTGTGPAQVFAGGYEFDATWTQPASGPPLYTRLDGSPAPGGIGLVWVCLVPTGTLATIR
jgi:hypothetical protein